MVDWVMNLAAEPMTAWWVLGLAGVIGGVEIIRTSKETLWGEFFAEDLDE